MPESPSINSTGVLKLSILSDGSPIKDDIGIQSVSVTATINKIPYAKIVLLDGDMPTKAFPVSDSDVFKPGSEIEIKAGYDDSEDTIFKGIVVKHGIKIGANNNSRLVIECRDQAVAMTIGRRNANYIDKKDSDIVTSLISNYAGLTSQVDTTTTTHKEMVQYYCSDWDFMLARAEVNGLLVCVESAKLSVKAPQVSAAADLKVTYGDDLIELQADIDARSQLTKVNAASWDPETQAVVEQQEKARKLNQQGDLASSDLARIVGPDTFRLQTPGLLEQGELKDWAKAQQTKAGLARIRGHMKFQGSAKARIGSLIELDGVGDRFNGSVFVSSVRHQIDQGNWISEVDFGMSPDWFAEQRDLVAPPASGLLPGIEGLQIGVVSKLDADPENLNRIQVTVPILAAETPGVWARLASFYASEEFGSFFIPEIGDEVIMGYLNNDPNAPIVLGSVYSGSKHKPPYELSAENCTKAIVTRSKLKVEFDDDKKIITIITPEDNKLVFSEEDESILMQDQNENKLELNKDGIVLESSKDISISAQGKITIEAEGGIAVTAKADLSAKGMNVNLEAQAGLVAKGSASAELSASGQTTVKGAMVMIN